MAKLSVTTTGDTLTSKENPITLPVPSYPNALYRVAISPKTQSDAAKMSQTLTRITEEDLTLTWEMQAATHQTLLFGMGDQHIDVALKRMEQKFQLNLVTLEPKVPYEEHITREASATYRHKNRPAVPGSLAKYRSRSSRSKVKISPSRTMFLAAQSPTTTWVQSKKVSAMS